MRISSAEARVRAIEIAAKRYYERMTGSTRLWSEQLPETEPDKDRSRQRVAQISMTPIMLGRLGGRRGNESPYAQLHL